MQIRHAWRLLHCRAFLMALTVFMVRLSVRINATNSGPPAAAQPDSPAQVARAFFRQGRLQDAADLLSNHVTKDPTDADAFFLLGAVYQAQKQPRKALESYSKSLQLSPHQYSAHYNTGLIYRHQQQPQHARSAFMLALKARPECPRTMNNVGLTYYFEGNHRIAIDWFLKASATNSSGDNSTLGEVYFNLGVCYSRLGQILRAESAYRRAMDTALSCSDIWVSAAMNLAALCTCGSPTMSVCSCVFV